MPDGALRRIRFAFLTGASAPDGRIRETAKKRLDRSFPEIIGNNKREFFPMAKTPFFPSFFGIVPGTGETAVSFMR
ncbi:hypothetical protein B4135_1629 [Caldibacillus debilis]|uniref:Uncharacterized protein n=1 Tax=Caldibacillus debilis TaxID=301148 RepID=A0A150MAZ1_9BACI|nr:hypothetical protein B4135_1629 [Caldibacillus debilis]